VNSEQAGASEEELRAWEEQLRRLQPLDVILQAVLSLISLAGRRLGVEPGTEGERDLEQVRDGIEGVRALLPLLERREGGPSVRSLRDALSALQLEYAKLAPSSGGSPGSATGGGPQTPPKPAPQEPGERQAGPAERSGRLWVPGQ
jgi:hypothetical protein